MSGKVIGSRYTAQTEVNRSRVSVWPNQISPSPTVQGSLEPPCEGEPLSVETPEGNPPTARLPEYSCSPRSPDGVPSVSVWYTHRVVKWDARGPRHRLNVVRTCRVVSWDARGPLH